jgi:hypothetical protein
MSTFKNHVNRKKACINDILQKHTKITKHAQNMKLLVDNNTLLVAESTINTNIIPVLSDIQLNIPNTNTVKTNILSKKVACKYCNKDFSRSFTLNRHLESFCKVKNNHENEKEQIYQKLLKELDEQKIEVKKLKDLLKDKDSTIQQLTVHNNTKNTNNSNNSNNTINNNNSNNTINNNITINAFGKEDISYITDKDYKEIFYSSSKSVPKLISKIHFNKKYPENANIYISNLKDSYIMVYDGHTWNMSMKTDTIDEIFDSKIIHLDGIFEDLLGKLDPTVKKRFKRFQFNLEHSSIEHDIKKELKLLLYNSRMLALKNKKKSEKKELIAN